MDRIILHIDVNNAFLSWSAVWMLKNGYNKDIRNRYAVIAGDESQRRGIVLAKSGLCKKRGVKTADPIYLARIKCPYLEVYPPKFEVYKKLIYLALDDANDVFEICSKTIISMSLANRHTEERFMEILSSMLDSFKECPNIDEFMTIVLNEEVNGED